MRPIHHTIAGAALALAVGAAAGAGSRRLPGVVRRHHRRRQEGRQGRRLQHDRHGRRQLPDQGLPGALSRHLGRVQRHELDRGLQPLHQREGSQRRLRRRALELVDGPADQARQRRRRPRLRLARDQPPADLGGVEERGVRHDLRAARDRLQQAASVGRRDPAEPRRPAARVHDQGRQAQGQGHDLRHREVRASASC